MRTKHTRTIAPRLVSGIHREVFALNLPPDIKAGLKAIAEMEQQSLSWVLEQTVISYFKLPEPKYRLKPIVKRRKGRAA